VISYFPADNQALAKFQDGDSPGSSCCKNIHPEELKLEPSDFQIRAETVLLLFMVIFMQKIVPEARVPPEPEHVCLIT